MSTLLSRIAADFETSLSSAVSIGDSSFTLLSVTDADGNTLSDGIYCFTLDRDNTSAKEYVVGQLTAATKTVSSVSSVSRQGVLTSNFQKAHRIGTNAIISDHSALNAIVKILNGTGTLDSGSPIGYDGTATISGANQLATKAYVDSVVNGGTVTYDKQILSGQTAGETLSAGQIVYLKASDSRWWKADADDSTTYDKVQLGVALGAGTAGNTISGGVQVSGVCSAFTGLTANTLYYLSSTAGGVSTSAGTPKISIGVATSTTSISLEFKAYSIPTGAERDAMAGGLEFGTPSSANKFVTEDKLTDRFNDENLSDSQVMLPYKNISALGNLIIGGANTLYVYPITLNKGLTINKLRFNILGGGTAGRYFGVAIYSTDGNTRYLTTGAIEVTSNALYTATLTPVTLEAGNYLIGYCASNTSVNPEAIATTDSAFFDGGALSGTAANSGSAGAPPATTGAISSSDFNVPWVLAINSTIY